MKSWTWLLFAAVALTGCPKETESDEEETEEEKDPPPKTVATQEPTAEPKASADLIPEEPGAVAGVVPKLKAEVDNRDPDGAAGVALQSGTKVTFTAPAGWSTEKTGAFNSSKSADGKAFVLAGSYGSTESPQTKRDEAATAAGLSECKWAGDESIAMGKDKIAASGADGVCKKGGTTVRTAYVSTTGEGQNMVSVGGWEEGSDGAGVFSTFRNAKASTGTGVPGGIAACCQAIKQNMASAPPAQLPAYQAALAACQAVQNAPGGSAALAGVRAALAGAGVPAPCR